MTEEFLGLDNATRGCHSELEDCDIKTFLEKAKRQCGCIPVNIKRFFPEEKVIDALSWKLPLYHPAFLVNFSIIIIINVRWGPVQIQNRSVWRLSG